MSSGATTTFTSSTFDEVFLQSVVQLSYSSAASSEVSEALPREDVCDLARRQEIFAKADEIGGREGAVYLHRNLSPLYWGVNRRQLRDFVRECRRAKLTNTPPPASSQPSPGGGGVVGGPGAVRSDESFARTGPSIYQVTAQYVLRRSGMLARPLPFASMALRWGCATGGIECGVFISHAWLGGLWEFADSALAAWPADCEGAYICFLSNPQHLRELLREMLEAPNEAPFRRVLRAGTGMPLLMLANSSTLVHHRLWCVYEVFWAAKLGHPVRLIGESQCFKGTAAISGAGVASPPEGLGPRRSPSTIAVDGVSTGGAASIESADGFEDLGGTGDAQRVQTLQSLPDGFIVDVHEADCSDAHDSAMIWEELTSVEGGVNRLLELLVARALAEDSDSKQSRHCIRKLGAYCEIL
eukprot:NODE_9739_length_1402_cov_5.520000.p1 GENE.NODE_9739_length_1402_cov_5.520000~~NODE_9739_length_1402_cov_5.520000.p1  ORF type:complete len:413 (-),score=136.81 NODE_9739_length_1402_cov_5.520000:42-1280(-)